MEFSLADLPFLNPFDWISLFNILSREQKYQPLFDHVKRMLGYYILEVAKLDVEVAGVLDKVPLTVRHPPPKNLNKHKIGKIVNSNWSVAYNSKEGLENVKRIFFLLDKHLYRTPVLEHILHIINKLPSNTPDDKTCARGMNPGAMYLLYWHALYESLSVCQIILTPTVSLEHELFLKGLFFQRYRWDGQWNDTADHYWACSVDLILPLRSLNGSRFEQFTITNESVAHNLNVFYISIFRHLRTGPDNLDRLLMRLITGLNPEVTKSMELCFSMNDPYRNSGSMVNSMRQRTSLDSLVKESSSSQAVV
ncbi:hypothetical protein L2E82_17929 [Cichorium intybus]|uniref:Uncharacterized protein n=1 Tax=Cichorium intybus TaxID=13427 RepID=A0ACB9F8F7_CICIN|nr:hypothetical protein L2E82_17929 [Cichorium intybus]